MGCQSPVRATVVRFLVQKPSGGHPKSNIFAGGPVDVEWMQESPRVGAIMTAWYPGEMARAILPSFPAATTTNP